MDCSEKAGHDWSSNQHPSPSLANYKQHPFVNILKHQQPVQNIRMVLIPSWAFSQPPSVWESYVTLSLTGSAAVWCFLSDLAVSIHRSTAGWEIELQVLLVLGAQTSFNPVLEIFCLSSLNTSVTRRQSVFTSSIQCNFKQCLWQIKELWNTGERGTCDVSGSCSTIRREGRGCAQAAAPSWMWLGWILCMVSQVRAK